jgi:hypothetical protein
MALQLSHILVHHLYWDSFGEIGTALWGSISVLGQFWRNWDSFVGFYICNYDASNFSRGFPF